MIERGGATEIATIDERDRKTPLCRIIRGNQTGDTATDDQQVVFATGQATEITNHSLF
jgi:hypothetical protein